MTDKGALCDVHKVSQKVCAAPKFCVQTCVNKNTNFIFFVDKFVYIENVEIAC